MFRCHIKILFATLQQPYSEVFCNTGVLKSFTKLTGSPFYKVSGWSRSFPVNFEEYSNADMKTLHYICLPG